jgi:hypothetical protein
MPDSPTGAMSCHAFSVSNVIAQRVGNRVAEVATETRRVLAEMVRAFCPDSLARSLTMAVTPVVGLSYLH